MEKKMSKKPQPKSKDNFTRNLVIAVVVGILAIMVVPKLLESKSDVNAAIPASVSKADGYGIAFNADIKGLTTVDIWEDFQCPICARFEETNGDYIASLIADKKAKVVFHTLSFIGNESILAANAAACSADENKFLLFHNTLYSSQPAENSGVWSNSYLANIGKQIGITSKSFSDCVTKGNYSGWVANVAKDGAAKNVNSTPTVFVNGKEIDRNTQYMNPVEFKKVIEAAL